MVAAYYMPWLTHATCMVLSMSNNVNATAATTTAATTTAATTTAATTTAATTTAATTVPALVVLHYRKRHPGNTCSYGAPGCKGIVWLPVAWFLPAEPPATVTLHAATVGGSVLAYHRKQGTHAADRHDYRLAGMPGKAAVDAGLLPLDANGLPYTALHTDCVLAVPAGVNRKDTITSAVVANGNAAVAAVAGTPIATPAEVAATAAAVVAAAGSKAARKAARKATA